MSETLLGLTLVVLIVAAALTTALLRDVLGAIIVFGGYSLGMALFWVVLRAPDVALTEAAVGAGVMTVLFLATIAKTTRLTGIAAELAQIDWVAGAVCVGMVGMVLATVPALPPLGADAAAGNPTFDHIAPVYLAEAYAETHVKNVVTAILVSYRGFDTLGEATVVFAAGVAVINVLRTNIVQ